jgi:hypothetical protein
MMTKTKFIHLRDTQDGKVQGKGGITVAFETDDAGYVLRSAAAICHPRDNFNRFLGRTKAAGRLKSERWSVNYMENEKHEKEFIQELRAKGLDLLYAE